MSDPTPISDRLYQLSHAGQVHTITLKLPLVMDPVEFDRLNDVIGQLAQERATHRWVLDLSQVEYVGSALLGLLVNLRQRIKSSGGKLILCGLSQQVLRALRTCSLHNLFTVTTTCAEAQAAAQAMQ